MSERLVYGKVQRSKIWEQMRLDRVERLTPGQQILQRLQRCKVCMHILSLNMALTWYHQHPQ